MGNSEYIRRELHVDTDTITTMQLDSTDFGELLTDPLTWIVSSKSLDSSSVDALKLQSPYSHCRRKAIASPKELQQQASTSTMSSPDLDDGYSTGSWTTSEESLVDYAEVVGKSPRVPYYDDWNSWFPPERPAPAVPTREALPTRGSSLSNINYDCTSPTSSTHSTTPNYEMSFPQRALSKPHLRQPQLKKQSSCIAFPQLVKGQSQQTYQSQSPFKLHKSWPLEAKASRPQMRDRANTTPQQPTDSHALSNLSTCTNMDDFTSTRSEYNPSPDHAEHLYMRSPMRTPPMTPLNASFSSTLSTSSSSTQLSSYQDFAEDALSAYISTQSYFFHDDDDGAEEKSWVEKQRAKFHCETRGYYIDPTSLPLLSDPPRLTPSQHLQQQRSDSPTSSSFPKTLKPKKKKPSLGKQAKELFSFTLTSRKSSARLAAAYQEDGLNTPPPTPPFPAPPLLLMQKKERKEDCKTCPKCDWSALQKREECDGDMLVTCLCCADLCYGCLRDWDYCEGSCASH